ncbi:B-cell receptor-associated protein 31 [Cimex lectularius]|uniref:Endoplasmic reticulum transmembrane protein n=1 Tax=Cimex lectularius TaxID=79782 RepID=A0A8I6SQL3_CIMLE|nr:B-cell receptor-associated protein 31 [Cimex lectularius]
MSLQWTLVAGFLYVEIAVVGLFVLPFISAKRWHQFFKSRFVQVLRNQANWYFGFVLLILVLFLLDAIREMRKYSNKEHLDASHHLESELQISMRLFRAQRNFYISGFSLFLSIVIRRFVSLLSSQATLMVEKEAVLKQAVSASKAARNLMSQGAGEAAQNSSNEAHQEEVNKLNEKINELTEELAKMTKDKEAALTQAKNVGQEFDKLLDQHNKLEEKLNATSQESKKDH